MTEKPTHPVLDTDNYIAAKPKDYGYSNLALRLWHGMTFGAWRDLYRGNLHKVPLSRLWLFISITLFTVSNSGLSLLSKVFFGRALKRTKIEPDPVFVLGFWRSGTTWLHQILSCDQRFCSPTSLQVFMPETFLILRKIMSPLSRFWLPESRPMDNMQLTTTSSEEDEVALLVAGAPSLMRMMAFQDYGNPASTSNISTLPAPLKQKWHDVWISFLTKVQFVNPGKRLLLKSPGHTMRVDEILRRFPNAKFVHIVRDPYEVALSNRKTSMAMTATQSLMDTMPNPALQFSIVMNNFVTFHDAFHAQRPAIPKGNITTIRYEDLKQDTKNVIRDVYQSLDLGGFENIEPTLDQLMQERKDYKPNKLQLDEELEQLVDSHWQDYFHRYGYETMQQRKPDNA